MGNTCYMNAALQCLTYTPPIANYMLSQEHSQTCHHQGFCMLCIMQAHITWVLQHPGSIIQPSYALAASFHRNEQEDAHEFLMFTLEAMQEASLSGQKHFDHPSEDSTLIRAIFGGYWRSQIKCLHCHSVSDTFDPYLDISLDIKTAQSVSQALEELVKPEELDGENAYHCSVCLERRLASKTLTLHASSKVLILVLKRFSDFTGEKTTKAVQYPECLDMQTYTSEQNRGPLIYGLYAVLVHAGSSCHNGHYFCYIKAGNGQWYKMDDAEVTACDVTVVLSQPAYVLFYVQKNELGRGGGQVSGGRESRALRDKGTNLRATGGGVKRDSHILESQGHLEKTSKEITFDQWKCLQEQNRPKSGLNLRKIDFTLPSNAAVIHPSKYRDEMGKNHSKPENYLSNNSARNITGQWPVSTGKHPCLDKRARNTKRKNKQNTRPLLVFQ
ncbi:Ubiquitin carboxyl-terminal hydrolase 17-like protein 2 [Tupaia chinensis]|uniref:Ubiquitin carboxyl-terminal hydrolase 17-like protein 2 n=2 Tax=Tupaia chinensis TaxID=246437 RepID=L8YD78_TUPCH|nr:Ubiquitin carboxyl-terminal hydrolase 17-like protein 2 [Tupaia chinensis]